MSDNNEPGAATPKRKRISWKQVPGQLFRGAVDLVVCAGDVVISPIVMGFGVRRMRYFFVFPILVFFGIFVLSRMFMYL